MSKITPRKVTPVGWAAAAVTAGLCVCLCGGQVAAARQTAATSQATPPSTQAVPASTQATTSSAPSAVHIPPGREKFPLASATVQKIPRLSLDELSAMFPAFQHEPFETAGFNVLALPFRFESVDGSGKPEEAYAFSFLLSASLDWADDSYCARHAYFVFKRHRRTMQRLAREYDPFDIALEVRNWGASHAMGGLLKHGKNGFAGTLEIYDRRGAAVFRKEYDAPREYFTLLGDMAVDAMTFFGAKPNDPLVKHLHRRRCEQEQSLIDLGEAAFVGERSNEEFSLYQGILHRDPNFADVRYWRANQLQWRDHDRLKYVVQLATALDSYPVRGAFREFDPAGEALPEHYKSWARQVSKLLGRDVSQDAYLQLKQAAKTHHITGELLERATREAGAHPNDYWLLVDLARAYSQAWDMLDDKDVAASLQIAALRNRYLTGTGTKDDALRGLATSLAELGRNDLAVPVWVSMLRQARSDNRLRQLAPQAWLGMGRALAKMGRYRDAIRYFRGAFRASRRMAKRGPGGRRRRSSPGGAPGRAETDPSRPIQGTGSGGNEGGSGGLSRPSGRPGHRRDSNTAGTSERQFLGRGTGPGTRGSALSHRGRLPRLGAQELKELDQEET